MEKKFDKYFPWFFLLGDVLIVAFSFFVASYFLADKSSLLGPDFSIFSIFLMVWMVITLLRKDYKLGRTRDVEKIFGKLFVSLAWFMVIVTILWMPVSSDSQRLSYFFLLTSSLFVFLSMYRVGLYLVLRKTRAMGFNSLNAVIMGKGYGSQKLETVLKQKKYFGIQFLGYYDDSQEGAETRGSIDSFFEEALALDVDLIYINQELRESLVRKIIDFADEHYIKVKIIPADSLQLEKNLSFSRYGDFFVINVNEIPLDNALNKVLKRAFDIVFSLSVTVFVLSWLIPLVGLLIKLESRGPIFFLQERNGRNNKVFHCLKFRSMMPNDYADTHQATKNDPRVTRIGSFLRKTSLDEMPQFLNVLIGDMSIVGPRPHPVPMNKRFSTYVQKYNARHRIKPGITGLAQVKGYRGEINYPYQIRSRVRLDYFYVQNWSIWMDLNICLKTVAEIFVTRKNAY